MMATCEEDKSVPTSPTESARVSENHSHVSSSSYLMIDPFTDQPLDQSLVQDFERVTVDTEENNNAEKNNTLEQACFFHRTGTCKFGANCKFNHSGEKAYQAGKESEGGQRERIECKFYLTTEGCKYGKSCRFSHSKESPEIPLQELNPSGAPLQSGKEKETEGFVGQTMHIECKYYLTTGGCRLGKACRYNHSKEKTRTNPPELNFLGLPMRPQEKECEFYIRTGTCGYGVTCRFHHPDPIAAEVSNSFNSTCSDTGGHSFGDCNRQSKISQSTWSSVQDAVPFSSHKKSIEALPCLDNQPPLAPSMHPLPDQVHLEHKPSHHQQSMESSAPDVAPCSSDKISIKTLPHLDDHPHHAPEIYSLPEQACPKRVWSHHQEKTRNPSSSLIRNNWITRGHVSKHNQEQIQDEVFPERPGQPQCNHFVRTGKCKYKSACRYDHPKVNASKFPVTGSFAITFNSKGLPLRPGKRICWHYEQFGICKHGPGCLYDHPEN